LKEGLFLLSILYLDLLLSTSSTSLSLNFLLKRIKLLMMRPALTWCTGTNQLTHCFEYFTSLLDVWTHFSLILIYEGNVCIMFLLRPMSCVDMRLLWFLQNWGRFWGLWLFLQVLLKFREQLALDRKRLFRHLLEIIGLWKQITINNRKLNIVILLSLWKYLKIEHRSLKYGRKN
jgi:hypothetical protein